MRPRRPIRPRRIPVRQHDHHVRGRTGRVRRVDPDAHIRTAAAHQHHIGHRPHRLRRRRFRIARENPYPLPRHTARPQHTRHLTHRRRQITRRHGPRRVDHNRHRDRRTPHRRGHDPRHAAPRRTRIAVVRPPRLIRQRSPDHRTQHPIPRHGRRRENLTGPARQPLRRHPAPLPLRRLHRPRHMTAHQIRFRAVQPVRDLPRCRAQLPRHRRAPRTGPAPHIILVWKLLSRSRIDQVRVVVLCDSAVLAPERLWSDHPVR